ncbi:MAG: TIGR03790 family protein [Candidatus Eisenbacteria bacterium]
MEDGRRRARTAGGGSRNGLAVPWRAPVALLLLVAVGAWPSCASDQPETWDFGTETRVLVVLPSGNAASDRIAERYVGFRHVAATHVVRLRCPDSEEITRDEFDDTVARPLIDWWARCDEEDRPSCLLLIRGLPHKIRGGGGRNGDRASVDSELTRLPGLARLGTPVAPHETEVQPTLAGPAHNPYFRVRGADGRYLPFDPARYGICLVTRLDGFTDGDASALVERAASAESEGRAEVRATTESTVGTGTSGAPGRARSGTDMSEAAGRVKTGTDTSDVPGRARSGTGLEGVFVIDLKAASGNAGEIWLRAAADAIREHGGSVALDESPGFVTAATDIAGYASWGSNDPDYRRPTDLHWRPGALACTFVSSSARTFREPPADWTPGPSASPAHRFEGSTQSLIGDLVRSGATGVSGNAYEPYLDGCVRPDVLFAAALEGRTLAEAFYLALPSISWQSVILGDPLCVCRGASR